MLIRALVVLLIVLNLGVAAWWALRTPPQAVAIKQPLGVARLQLASEVQSWVGPASATPLLAAKAAVTAPAVPAPAGATPAVTRKVTVALPTQCYSFGPFTDPVAAKHAHDVLMTMAARVVPREIRTGTTRVYRVLLPVAASLAQAQATAQRIAAAGFDDYFIVREGSEANSIALGRYRSEESARRRVQSLAAAGFPAHAEPINESRASYWLDLVPGPSFDPARAQAAVQAAPHSLACARLQ